MYAETEEYQHSVAVLNANIEEAFRKYSRPYVAYSGGKDSLVMAHVILKHFPGTLVFHWDYGKYYMPRELEHEVMSIARQIGAANIRIDTTPIYNIKKRTAEGVLGSILYGRVLKELRKEGYDLGFVGLRAQESCKRALRTKYLFEHDKIMDNCFPVRHMSTRDIWSYIVANGLPYCSHYDLYGELQGLENVRFCTFFDPEFDKFGNSNIDGLLMTEFKNYE
jgi:3'-phosphoadenosine 5'-phosphosulfate sulfotransferase (PAPS reductase)/FAD synthetase